MIKVSNGKWIRHLSRKSFKAAKTRNIIAVFAIALTTLLFTSLFTIAASLNDGFQQSNFRQCGGWSHGGFKYLTEEQFNELKDDPLIKEWGLRRFIGMPDKAPFEKSHVEIGYSDANQAHWMYCDPIEGRLPQEGTKEAATDLRILELLGVEPKLGTEFTVTFNVDNKETTQTFVLCGWWEYDEAIVANHILIPESRVDSILTETGVDPENSGDGITGSWNLDVMVGSSLHIERDINRILHNHGYQSESASSGDNYIAIGVNWGYSGSRLADSIDPGLIAAIIALLLLILFTGYLIIYNVFQISVSNDIRFYGLLKTIGTTPKQLRKIIRHQALLLALIGIPLGLVGGWLVGAKLTPVIVSRFNGIISTVSINPVIFIGAALFALLTVLLSCARPGRIASAVSPVEAIRYTENSTIRQKVRKTPKQNSLFSMAKANLNRSRSKTVVTIVSLALSVILLNATVTFTNGFDMDKYLSNFVATDFIVADTAHFQRNGALQLFNTDNALPEEIIDIVNEQGGITEGGAVYGKVSPVQEFITEDHFRSLHGQWEQEDALNWLVDSAERNEAGLLADDAQLYGMTSFALDQLEVVEGDLSALYEPGTDAIAAVCDLDDYGNPIPDSYWAKVGDTVTLRYAEEFEYYNPDTGEIYTDGIPENEPYNARAVRYRDVSYTVAAVVSVPYAISYQYYGDDTFVLNEQTFIRDTGTDSILLYAFNTTDEANEAMEAFLTDFTENRDPSCDYDSKAKYQSEFESFRSMFLLMGGALSFIIGLVGILNFFNVILTGIISRKQEFAVLQSIGMTGRQLKKMLIYEGLIYTLGSLLFALTLTVLMSPLLSRGMKNMFWFFSYHFTVAPILLLIPVFLLLGIVIPLRIYRSMAKATIVERLREAEN